MKIFIFVIAIIFEFMGIILIIRDIIKEKNKIKYSNTLKRGLLGLAFIVLGSILHIINCYMQY